MEIFIVMDKDFRCGPGAAKDMPVQKCKFSLPARIGIKLPGSPVMPEKNESDFPKG